MWATGIRFIVSGAILLFLIHRSPWLGQPQPITPKLRRRLWWGPGLVFTCYLMSFIWALKFTTASNVAVYFAASPVFAVLWDRLHGQDVPWKRMLLATPLALSGVAWFFLPTLSYGGTSWIGDGLAFLGSLLWVHFSHLCRQFQGQLPAAQLNGETFKRTALLIAPFVIYDQFTASIPLSGKVIAAHVYATLGPSIFAFLTWSYALRHWPTSRVMLAVNLIPLTTALLASLFLDEVIPKNFWTAMLLVASGVSIAVTGHRKNNTPTLKPSETGNADSDFR